MPSTTSNKRIAKNTIMLYIRMLLLMLVTFYTSRVVLNALGVKDFGLYSVVGSIVIFLGFINTSMTSASQRFLSYYQGKEDKDKLNVVFNSVYATQIIISLIIFITGEILGVFYISYFLNVDAYKITDAHIVYQFSLLSFVFKTLTVPYTSSIIANEKMDAFAIISIIDGILQLCAVSLLKYIDSNRLIAYAALTFGVILTTQSLYRVYSKMHFEECKINRNWDRSIIKDIFSYSSWNLLGSFSKVAISQGVNLILNSFFGVVVNAARGIAFQVSGATASLSGNFQQALNPQIVKRYASNELDSMHKLILRGTKLGFFLLLVFFVPIFFNMSQLLTIWLGKVPDYTVIFCKLIIINALISALSNSLLTGALATGKIMKYQIIISSINFLNIPLSLIALMIYPEPVITVYIMIAVSIMAFTGRLILTSKMINLSKLFFVKKAILPILYTSIAAIVICSFVNLECAPTQYILLFINMFALFVITAICIGVIGLDKDERTFALNVIKSKIKR